MKIGADVTVRRHIVHKPDISVDGLRRERRENLIDERRQAKFAYVERDISAFDLGQLGDVGDQSVHAFGISTDDGEESTIIVGVVDRAVLERFDICKDRSKWCAKLVRDVRKKFLSDVLKAFKLSDVVKDADRLQSPASWIGAT